MTRCHRLSLLFVDADPRVLDDMRGFFNDDFDVFTASRVHEALQLLDEQPIDVVVADDRLDEASGIELLHWFRLRSPRAARILLSSPAAAACEPAAVRRAQLFRVLTKPCPPEALHSTVLQAGRAARLTHVREEAASRVAAGAALQQDGEADADGDAAPEAAASGRVTRIWSTHGITVEEEEFTDPDDTARVFAGMLADAERRRQEELARAAAEADAAAADRPGAGGASNTGGARAAGSPPRGAAAARQGGPRPGGSAAAAASGAHAAASARSRPGTAITARGSSQPSAAAPAAGRNGAAAGRQRQRPGEDYVGKSPLPGAPREAGLLVLTPDAITAAEVRAVGSGWFSTQHAATPLEAVDRLCSGRCGALLVDGRYLSAPAIGRTVRLLRQVVPGLCTVILAAAADEGELGMLDPDLGIVGVVQAPFRAQDIAGLVGWSMERAQARDPGLPAAAGGDRRELGHRPAAGAGTDADAFVTRLRRANEGWPRA